KVFIDWCASGVKWGVFFLVAGGVMGSLVGLYGQNQTGPKNLLMNPGFERYSTVDVPWYGTAKDGSIRGMQGGLPILSMTGEIVETPMPVSVAAGDLNGDGLEDLVVGSVNGYLHVFFNQGTKEEPKFGYGEIIPIFLGPSRRWQAPRVHLADPGKAGKLDLFIGTYGGDILRIPNSGSNTAPDYRPQPKLESFVIPTTKDGRRWGNVFAPCLYDFNRDGKVDLLIGEGSYSANSVHIFLNQATGVSLRFDEENRHVLAYGMGRDQLSPVVVDYDEDGNPDLLVSDSSGQIGLYSSTVKPKDAAVEQDIQLTAQAGGKVAQGGSWNPGEHIPFVQYLESQGRPLKFTGITSIGKCDLNGDGLFDLVVGQSSGQVSWVRNSGEKGAPKFEQPVVLKGEPARQVYPPTSWTIGMNLERGNFFATATTVSNEEDANLKAPEGKRALRIFFSENKNAILKTPISYIPQPGQDGKPVP
ncbi:MAG: FG-GAP-like repeat-containing protein, partial [Chthoniobacterales bacterium]|nr:FG-GAP-like repeat-containing protein [Chthoniobacterales bacterium]